MSKLSFRARALDPAKPMPIYLAEELPDLPEYSAINRAVPQMPSGMEKEEESEHHLQRAICTGLIIPTPEVFTCDQDFYDRSYPPNYKMPRQMIHMQPLGLEQDTPDYDMDSADETWVNQQSQRLELNPMKFEQMMDRLEKSSGQTVVTLNEAKALLKQDDEVSIAVYDYWLNKRLNTQHPLILSVKTENRPGTSANNPYLAFRRRTEKMQTRKNRKNDETSYEKMLKLRRDLCRATTVLEMVKRREKTKREQLHLSIEIFEKRVQLRDYSGSLMSELSSTIKNIRPAFAPLYTNQYSHNSSASSTNPVGGVLPSNTASTSGGHSYSSTSQYLNSSSLAVDPVNASSSGSRKEKRQYKKRKHKISRDKQYSLVQSSSPAAIESAIETEEEDLTSNPLGSEGEDDGQYAFRRNKNCNYHRPLIDSYGNWPWESKNDHGFGDKKYRYTLTSIRHPRPRFIGFARRRLGRGGRVILDRASTNMDDFWSKLDYNIMESSSQNPAESLNANPANKQAQSPTRTCRRISENNGESIDYNEEDENVSWDPFYVSAFVKPVPTRRPKIRKFFQKDHGLRNIINSVLSEEIKREQLNESEELLSYLPSRPENADQQQQKQQQPSTSSTYKDVIQNFLNNSQMLTTAGGGGDGVGGAGAGGGDGGYKYKFNVKSSSSSSSYKISCNNLTDQSYNSINRTTNNVSSYINSNDGKPNVISADVVVKKEMCDSADLNILDDENVNLARLSSYINANRNYAANQPQVVPTLIKSEPVEGGGGLTINNNQLPKSQFTEAKDVLRQSSDLKDCFEVIADNIADSPGTCPPSNNPEEEYHESWSDIERDWLHFRPRTPPSPIEEDDKPVADDGGESGEKSAIPPAVSFSAQTPIAVELQCLRNSASPTVFFNEPHDALFVTKPFTYSDLEPDSQFLPSVFAANYLSKSPANHNLYGGSPHSGMDLNLSGDSLNDMSFSLGEDDNENMLDNILQACQNDELKTLNQATNFWSGILDDPGAGLLDCIEDKKLASDAIQDEEVGDSAGAEVVLGDDKDLVKSAIYEKLIDFKKCLGSSTFLIKNGLKDENFFKKEELKEKLPEVNKIEPPDEILASPPPPPASHTVTEHPPAQQQTQLMQQQGLLPTSEFSANTSIIHQSGQRTALRVVHPLQQQQQQQLQQNLHLQLKQNVVTPVVSQSPVTARPSALTSMATTNHTAIITTQDSNGNGTVPQEIYIKQSNCNVGGVVGANQVPNLNLSQHNAVLTLANVKLRNDVGGYNLLGETRITSNGPNHGGGGGGLVDAGGGSSSGNGNMISTDNIMTTHQTPTIVTTAKPQQQQQTQQIVWRHVGQGATGILSNDANSILWTSRTAQKKQLNGPEVADKLLLSRKIAQRKVQQQFQVLKTDDDSNTTTMLDGSNHTTQKTVPAGKVIKMSSYPVVVSELSVQQQQNSAAVAANHNYSLRPTSQPITMISQHSNSGVSGSSGNKLILSTSGPSGSLTNSGNLTIATSSGDLQNKIHYKEIPNTNLKLNFVQTGSLQQGNIVVDSKNTINAQQLNNQQLKTAQQQQQQQQQQLQSNQQQVQKVRRERILNIIGGGDTPDNKRVYYVHKNNSGQMQMQISPNMTTYVSKNLQRLANNQTIFTNMRTLPISNQVVNTQSGGVTVSAAGTTTAMFTTSASPKTSNDISVKINNNSNDMATSSSTINAGTPATAATANSNSLSTGINLNTTNR